MDQAFSLRRAWAASVGLADLSNVALLKRLRKCGPWMEHLASLLLSGGAQPSAQGRRIRLVDGTTVSKAGKEAKTNNGLWRLHCAFDLPAARLSFIELTDEKGGERLDRVSFAKGDVVVADRGFMHPDPLAHILGQGADVIVRTGWRGARWSARMENPSISWLLLRQGRAGVIDSRSGSWPQKSAAARPSACCVSQAQAGGGDVAGKGAGRRKSEGHAISAGTLTQPSGLFLSPRSTQRRSPPQKIGELYRARWRIELAFKRLKSLIGLSAPPSEDRQIGQNLDIGSFFDGSFA